MQSHVKSWYMGYVIHNHEVEGSFPSLATVFLLVFDACLFDVDLKSPISHQGIRILIDEISILLSLCRRFVVALQHSQNGSTR